MILKRPYAFLIKHFKLIHLILFILLAFVIYRFSVISSFFNNYVKFGYTNSEANIAFQYVTTLIYIVIVFVLIVTLIIYFLFREKEKPTKFYVSVVIYYVILMIVLFIFSGALNELQTVELTTKTIRAYRDFSILFLIPQYFFAIVAFIRGIGFDIKKFNFSKDISQMEIEARDKEEVEVSLNLDNYKLKRKIRRFFRELKYRIKENKLATLVIAGIGLIIVTISILSGTRATEKVYKENQSFNIGNNKITIVDSKITNLDYEGNIINKKSYYLIVMMEITNLASIKQTLNLNNFRVLLGKDIVFPTVIKNEKFIDLGKPYLKQELPSGEKVEYLIVFEIPKDKLQTVYNLKVRDNDLYKNGIYLYQYKLMSVKPMTIDSLMLDSTNNLGEVVTFNYSNLMNSTLLIKDYLFTSKYEYNYDYCVNSKCNKSIGVIDASYQTTRNKTLLIMNYEFSLDKNVPFSKNIKKTDDFFNYLMSLEYNIGGKTYKTKVVNRSTPNLPNKLIVEVNKSIMEASEINLIFNVRDKRYEIKIK